MNESWHNPDLALIGRNNTWTIRANETRGLPMKRPFDPDHLIHWDPLRDADDEPYARIGSFQNRIRRKRGRHKDQGCGGFSLLDGFTNRIEYRDTFHFLPGFAWRHPGHDLRSVGFALGRVKRPFFSGYPLNHDPGVLIDQNTHATSPFTNRGE
jgi:hypothetical protein